MSLKAMTCAMALRGVTASEKLLLLALANYADENMTCYPSQKRLAADACLSPRTVQTLLASLEERRMISRERRSRPDGSRSTDSITLHFSGTLTEATSGGAEIIAGGVQQPLPGGGEMVAPLTTFEPVNEPVNGTTGRVAAPAKRASKRCPDDWSPSAADLAVATELGFTPGEIERELATIRDCTFGVARSDWSATFRNWFRREAKRKPRNDRPDRFAAKQANYQSALAGADWADQVLVARRGF